MAEVVKPIKQELGVNGLMTVAAVDEQLASLRGGSSVAGQVAMMYARDRLLSRRAALEAENGGSATSSQGTLPEVAGAAANLRTPADVVGIAAGTVLDAVLGSEAEAEAAAVQPQPGAPMSAEAVAAWRATRPDAGAAKAAALM